MWMESLKQFFKKPDKLSNDDTVSNNNVSQTFVQRYECFRAGRRDDDAISEFVQECRSKHSSIPFQELCKIFAKIRKTEMVSVTRQLVLDHEKWIATLSLRDIEIWLQFLGPQGKKKCRPMLEKCVMKSVQSNINSHVNANQMKSVQSTINSHDINSRANANQKDDPDEDELRRALRESMQTPQLQGNKYDCVICLSQPPNLFFEPCGHVVCCNDCVSTHKIIKCPICQVLLSNLKRAYLS